MRLLFDIEADDLLDKVSRIHCAVVKNLDTLEVKRFEPHQIDKFLLLLDQATELVGHNILNYDLPAIEKVKGWRVRSSVKIVDTLVLSRICFSDLERNDWDEPTVGELNGAGLVGSHSLESWGIRLGCAKGKYGKTENAWHEFSLDMLMYCQQDVEVNWRLLNHLMRQNPPADAIDMEMRFAAISEQMSRNGFTFDVESAEHLCVEVEAKQNEFLTDLRRIVDPEVITGKKPRWYRVYWPDGTVEKFETKGEADAERKRRKIKPAAVTIKRGPPMKTLNEFNPGSRDQIRAFLFERYGWVSPKLTDTGSKLLKAGEGTHASLARDYGSVDEDTLSTVSFTEAKPLIGYLMCSKLMGQLKNGPNGWLKKVEGDGKIRHRMNTIGCATFRCSHATPNLGQVPSVAIGKDKHPVMGFDGGWGYESRSLFVPSDGYVQVGVDLQGIEARMLGHFLKQFDRGAYIDQVLHGDIHSLNTDAIKRITGYTVGRNDFKSSFYGYLYGAGNAKLGLQLTGICSEALSEYTDMYERNMRGTIKIRDPKNHRNWIEVAGSEFPAHASDLAYGVLGKRVRESLEVGITGLGELLDQVKKCAERGYLTPLDKRKIPVRSPHSALNSLLQGTAAIVMKRWSVICWDELIPLRKIDARLLAVVHDEHQAEVRPEHVDRYSRTSIESIRLAGEYYKLHIPLDGEAKMGKSWAECH